MRTPLIASSALLALAASFATASAALIIHTTPGLVSPALTLDAGTYKIAATGAAGNAGRNGGVAGGFGVVIRSTFTFASLQTLRIVVGGQGGVDSGGGGGGGGGTFVFWVSAGLDDQPLLAAGGFSGNQGGNGGGVSRGGTGDGGAAATFLAAAGAAASALPPVAAAAAAGVAVLA